MLILYKVWVWLKNYWYVPLILLLIVAAILVGKTQKSKLLQYMRDRNRTYKEQIENLERSREVERELKDEAHEEYQEKVYKVEKEFKAKKIVLDKDKKKRVRAIVKETKGDNKKLAEMLAGEFNLEYVEEEE